MLDTALDDALRAEGYARDVVRAVQDARKAAGLQVADRIPLDARRPGRAVAGGRGAPGDSIARETLATVGRGRATRAGAAASTVDAVEAGGYEA